MNNTNLHPLLASSIDPTKISATVTGFLTSISGIVLLWATIKHFPITNASYGAFVQTVGGYVFSIASAGGSAYMLYGLLRKVALALLKPKSVPLSTVSTTQQ